MRARLGGWLVLGACAGWLDWVLGSILEPMSVGPWLDRLGSGAVSMLTHGLFVAALWLAVGVVLWPLRGWKAAQVVRLVIVASIGLSVVGMAVVWHLGLAATATRSFEIWWTWALPLALAGVTLTVGVAGFRRGEIPRVTLGWSRSVAFLVLALVAAASFPGQWKPAPKADERLNVILISIDTLRSDHLGCYGYDRDTSPAIDAFAAGGVLFETAYSQSNWTLPSHASMLTGVGPLAHGALHKDGVLGARSVTLAERLSEVGYTTAAMVGVGPFSFVGARRGFDQGFDTFLHAPHARSLRSGFLNRVVDHVIHRYVNRGVGEAAELSHRATQWLKGHRQEPFFLFLHFYDVHSKFADLPYEAPEPFFDRFCPGELQPFAGDCGTGHFGSRLMREVVSERIALPDSDCLERVTCLYDGGIAFVDHEVGKILEALEVSGLDQRSLIIITSDHGEAIGDHGWMIHETVYEEIARVPLIVRAPGGLQGHRAGGVASLVDIVPTVLDLVGLTPAEAVEGESLAAAIVDPEASAGFMATTVGTGLRHSSSLRRGRYKFIDNRESDGQVDELFDLVADPEEERNLVTSEEHIPVAEGLGRELDRRRALAIRLGRRHFFSEAPDDHHIGLPDEERERLRELGYID